MRFKFSFLQFALLMVGLCCGYAAEGRPEESWRVEAESFLREQQWSKALSVFREQSKSGNSLTPEDTYNFGTAALQAGSPGEAFVLLRKFTLGRFWDPDGNANLRLARDRLPQDIQSTVPATWFSWWPSFLRPLPFSFWLLVALLLLPFFLHPLRTGKEPAPWQWSVLALAILASVAGGLKAWQTRTPSGGLLTLAQLYSGPGSTYPQIRSLGAGSLVNLEEFREGWVKVRFVDANLQETVGWVESSTALKFDN